jgi:acetoin utilization deacetylase AcuC-like enzyme
MVMGRMTFSRRLPIDGIENVTLGRSFSTADQAPQYLEELDKQIRRFREFDAILYQAGADVQVDDPLGGVLTTEQMRERDRAVFAAAERAGAPLAWNLAGGYQELVGKVVALHVNTMRECVRAYVGR